MYGVIRFENQNYIACTTIEEFYDESKNGMQEKAYHLKSIKIESTDGRDGINPTTSMPDIDSTIMISDTYNLVKKSDSNFNYSDKSISKYVLNEDGTPKVFYHGTNETFDNFDISKRRANMDIQGSFLPQLLLK